MKIYSWNVLFKKQDPGEVLFFIENTDFDVLALQEVPGGLLPKIKNLDFNSVFSIDHTRIHKTGNENCYLAIISKHKIQKSGSQIINENPEFSLQSNMFFYLEDFLYNLMGFKETPTKTKNHRFLWADIKIQNEVLRFFSCHLEHGGPQRRLSNLLKVEKSMSEEGTNIICGDFNTIYNPLLNIYNWLRGSKIKEALPTSNERKIMRKHFSNLGLKNPLAYKVTHTFFPSQLDHILVPKSANVAYAKVLPERHGSDHYPVSVEVSLP